MSKILLIVLFFAVYSLSAWPQANPYSRVKGRITDKETQEPLANATVVLLYAKDSLHAGTVFTDKRGDFVFNGVKPGNYWLYITYLGYQQQLKMINVTDTLVELGGVFLHRTGVTLGTVEIVKVRAPMVIKRDTLEFNADYYKTRENAVMEELLRKLPGVEITPDGTIKVNGETVKRIFVDGKPFFGDNPKLAIRNLPADMIDKVQLIDRKSEQAQFTGVEDGKREKAINITVKKEKKGQFLGSIAAGYGTDGRFAGNLSINRFGEGEQISFLGGANNVNNTGFLQDVGQGIGTSGNGITQSWNGGVNYNKDLSKEWKLGASYLTSGNHTRNDRASTRQNLLPDTTYYYNQDAITINDQMNHIIDANIEYRPDTLHFLKVSGNLNFITTDNYQQNIYESLNGQHQLVNSGWLWNDNTSNALNTGTSVFFGKQFKTKGRKLSSNFYFMNNASRQKGYNRSNSSFIQPTGEAIQDTINQHKDINNRQRMIQFSVTYSEPVFKDRFLDFFYAHIRDNTMADRLTYDFNAAKRQYDQLNDSLSNTFKNITTFNVGNVSLRTKKKKYDYTVGWNIIWIRLMNENVTKSTSLVRNSFHFFPTVFFNYAFTSSNRLRFSYNGNPQPPTVDLLQPIPDNSNPLYIEEGDPDLKVAFSHNFSLGYNAMNATNLRSFSLNFFATLVKNKAINMNWFDSLGRQVSRPVNVNGTYNFGINMVNVFPLKKLQTAINVNTAINLSRDFSYTNNIKNEIRELGITQGLGFHYVYKTLFDVQLTGNVIYNGIRYPIQPGYNTNYFNYNISFNTNVNLPLGFMIGGSLDYRLNAGRQAGYNLDATLLNATIAKSLLSNKQALIKLQVFDLLDRNVSIGREVGESYIEDAHTMVLQRFFMLSFSWFLKPAQASK